MGSSMGSSAGSLVNSLEESLVGLARWVGLSLRPGESWVGKSRSLQRGASLVGSLMEASRGHQWSSWWSHA